MDMLTICCGKFSNLAYHSGTLWERSTLSGLHIEQRGIHLFLRQATIVDWPLKIDVPSN